jgi:alcohol dehydrogenase class IV
LKPIVPDLDGKPGEAEIAALRVEEWLYGVGLKKKLSDYGFTEAEIPGLVKLVKETPGLPDGLKSAPIDVSEEDVSKIYRESLHPFS